MKYHFLQKGFSNELMLCSDAVPIDPIFLKLFNLS